MTENRFAAKCLCMITTKEYVPVIAFAQVKRRKQELKDEHGKLSILVQIILELQERKLKLSKLGEMSIN